MGLETLTEDQTYVVVITKTPDPELTEGLVKHVRTFYENLGYETFVKDGDEEVHVSYQKGEQNA